MMANRITLKRRRGEDSQLASDNLNRKKRKTEQNEVSMDVDHSESNLFTPRELRLALMPTLEKICQSNGSAGFRMDVRTIKDKLSSEGYLEPWEFVDDVWSMFEKPLSNPKTTRIYKYCYGLSEVFEQEITCVMQELGYCCGRKYKFDPKALPCSGKEFCTVAIGAEYFRYRNFRTFFIYCENCFKNIPGDSATLYEGSPCQMKVKKDQFSKMKNNLSIPEPIVICQDCGRKLHQVCVLYLERNWPDGFVCDTCSTMKKALRKENSFRAKNLPITRLGSHIEIRLNNFLRENQVNSGQVHIRMLFNYNERVVVKPGMCSLFVESGELNAEFPYRSKAIFAFQEIDGVDVCFFGMYVQEYGSECANPNSRRICFTYLDSVHYFQPRQHRTAVFHEILLGYMEYAKLLGYQMVHIWACPPPSDQNYIFYCHPSDQKTPNVKRLQKWYKEMLDKGKNDQILVDYKNIFQQVNSDKLTSVAELPYFDEDFWPYFMEESINELNQRSHKKAQKKVKKRRTKTRGRPPLKKNEVTTSKKAELNSKVFASLRKFKDKFFIAQLHSPEAAANLPPIQDPDVAINSDLMQNHNSFFNFARDWKFEFSSLRRAKFSTMQILYELQKADFFYMCDNCRSQQIKTWYHCRVCDDYDLCEDCKDQIGHIHKMDKRGLVQDDETLPDLEQAYPRTNQESIQSHLETLNHISHCRDSNCRIQLCQQINRAIDYTKSCKKAKDDCQIRGNLHELFTRHVKNCEDINCPHFFCRNMKATAHVETLNHRISESYLTKSIEFLVNRYLMVSAGDNFRTFMGREEADRLQVLHNVIVGILLNARTLLQEVIRIIDLHRDRISNKSMLNVVSAADSTVQDQNASAQLQVEEF